MRVSDRGSRQQQRGLSTPSIPTGSSEARFTSGPTGKDMYFIPKAGLGSSGREVGRWRRSLGAVSPSLTLGSGTEEKTPKYECFGVILCSPNCFKKIWQEICNVKFTGCPFSGCAVQWHKCLHRGVHPRRPPLPELYHLRPDCSPPWSFTFVSGSCVLQVIAELSDKCRVEILEPMFII